MTSGGGEGRTNWESVTLIRIYLNITWTQQGLRIGYFDFSQVHSRRYFSKFPRYTAGFIFRIFPGTQQAIFLRIFPGTQQAIFLRFFPGTQQAIFLQFSRCTAGYISPFCPRPQVHTAGVICHHKIVGIQQVLKLKNVT